MKREKSHVITDDGREGFVVAGPRCLSTKEVAAGIGSAESPGSMFFLVQFNKEPKPLLKIGFGLVNANKLHKFTPTQ